MQITAPGRPVAAAPGQLQQSTHHALTSGLGGRRLALPSLWQIGLRFAPQFIEGALVPFGLFLATAAVAGTRVAMAVGLSWSAVAIARRTARSRRIPTMILVGAAMLVVRAVIAAATGSVFLYFLQPMLGAGVLATAFIWSVVRGRPLARRFASDLALLPSHVFDDPVFHDFFQRVSVMWAIVVLANAGFGFCMLVTQSTAVFLAARLIFSIAVIATAMVASTLWFTRSASRVLANLA